MKVSPISAVTLMAVVIAPALWGAEAASAQQPSSSQISAVRQSCRSDFMANCSGVQPGGKDALDCLKQNLAKLSGACKAAVSAIGPAPVATPPAPAPAPAATLPAASPAPTQATPKTANVPTPNAPAAKTTKTNPPPQRLAAPPAPAAPVAPSPPAAAAPPETPDIEVIRPREALRIIRICAADRGALCADVPPGGGRIIACLVRNASALSPPCRDALAQLRQ